MFYTHTATPHSDIIYTYLFCSAPLFSVGGCRDIQVTIQTQDIQVTIETQDIQVTIQDTQVTIQTQDMQLGLLGQMATDALGKQGNTDKDSNSTTHKNLY